MPKQTSISSTHTGVGTARKKVKSACVATESTGTRNTFRAASMPNTTPSTKLYSRESTAIETVSTREEKIRSMLEKSKCARSQNTTPMSGIREAILPQSIPRYSRLTKERTATPMRKAGMNRLRWRHFTGIRLGCRNFSRVGAVSSSSREEPGSPEYCRFISAAPFAVCR